MRKWILLYSVALLALCGCDAIRYPPEGWVFRTARSLAQSSSDLPAKSVLGSQQESKVLINKNMAAVEMPYRYTDSTGKAGDGVYVIWLKRINRRWELDHAYIAPRFNQPSP